jgi:hypothetical protein
MNCDQAFDYLTNPQLRDAEELQAHFSTCPRCRNLADVLEPALGLFDDPHDIDSMQDHDSWQSENEHDGAVLEFDEVHSQSSQQNTPQHRVQSAPWMNAQRQQQRRSARRDGSKVAILLLFVAAITAAFANVGREERAEQRVAANAVPCIREATDVGLAPNKMVAQCVSCHADLVQLTNLENRQQAEATQVVTKCVTCHLKPVEQRSLNSKTELLHACLFPMTKS